MSKESIYKLAGTPNPRPGQVVTEQVPGWEWNKSKTKQKYQEPKPIKMVKIEIQSNQVCASIPAWTSYQHSHWRLPLDRGGGGISSKFFCSHENQKLTFKMYAGRRKWAGRGGGRGGRGPRGLVQPRPQQQDHPLHWVQDSTNQCLCNAIVDGLHNSGEH